MSNDCFIFVIVRCHGSSVGVDTAKVKKFREALDLSMSAAARLAKMKSAQHWNSVESGDRANPSIDTVQRMAKALGVKVDDLLK